MAQHRGPEEGHLYPSSQVAGQIKVTWDSKHLKNCWVPFCQVNGTIERIQCLIKYCCPNTFQVRLNAVKLLSAGQYTLERK